MSFVSLVSPLPSPSPAPSSAPSNSPSLFPAVSDSTGAVPFELSPADPSRPHSYMIELIKSS